jgi:DNA-directed RNA polymerase subunit RPC12/RpoP
MLSIVKFKGCKRCGGDLVLDRDTEGTYIACLQCSAIYVKRLVPIIPKAKPRLNKLYAR